jgi:hypothetical protein
MKYFWDGTSVPAYASPGGIEHTYKEGIYDAKIIDLPMVKKLK